MIESAVAAALESLGLPPPRRMFAVRHGTARTFEVELHGGRSVWVRVPISRAGLAALRREEAALALLRSSPAGDPIASPYSVMAYGDLVLAVLPRPPGRPASDALGADGTAIARAVGAWLARVPADQPAHGTMARDGVFVRDQPTWAATLDAHLQRIRTRLARSGWGLGTVEEQLARRVSDGLAAAARADAFAVVHRDLAPDRVYVRDGLITGVVDWERAWLADPLLQWAPLVVQPPAVLGPMLDAHGAEAVRDGADRLEGYASFEVLARYEARLDAAIDDNARAAAAGLAVHEAGVLGSGVRALLDAAVPTGGVWPGWVPDPAAVLLRRVLVLLATEPDPFDRRIEHLLAGALLSGHPENPEGEAWRALTFDAARGVDTAGEALPGPTDDRLDRALRVPGPFASGALTAWLVRTALERVDTVDPAVRAACARRVECLACLDERPAIVEPEVTLLHLLLGLAASIGTAHQRTWARRLREEWSDIAPTVDAAPFEDALRDPRATIASAPALLALLTIPADQLPADRAAVLAAVSSR
ncbi:MAG: hypothetical protein H6737_30005 [Alphaproteobacteria bacterium]|nr:hypothetical protein [Alphaproteobacteria bacterium]